MSFWQLDARTVFLNHGSFGAVPLPVAAAQDALRRELETQPVAFMLRRYPELLDSSRRALAAFVGARPADLVFVANATTGVATVVESWRLRPGDEVLALDHAYPACRNALIRVLDRAGARLRGVALPEPLDDPEAVVAAIVACVTPRTRFALLDHITSPSALVLPIAAAVAALRQLGVETLVDAAHAPGMVPLALDDTGAAWTTGNLHKWVCAPKGAAFLHVRADQQRHGDGSLALEPLVTSHAFRNHGDHPAPLHPSFDWCGTFDPTAWLSVPAALQAVRETCGGWNERMARNHALAVAMQEQLAQALPLTPLATPTHLGSMASLRLSPAMSAAADALPPSSVAGVDRLQDALYLRHRVEVPVMPVPAVTGTKPSRGRLLRVSAQVYNSLDDIEALIAALRDLLGPVAAAHAVAP